MEDGTQTIISKQYKNGATEPSQIVTNNYDASGNWTNEVISFAEDRSYLVDTLNYNENHELVSQLNTAYDSAGKKISTSTWTSNADQTSTRVTETYDSAGTMTEKSSYIINENAVTLEQVTETYNNGATEPSIVRKYISRADGTLSSTEEKTYNEDRSYSVSITNYAEDGTSSSSTKYYNSDGTEKTEPAEQPQLLATNSVMMLTAGISPQMNHNPELDSATDNTALPVQEESGMSNTVTDETEILNEAPSAGTAMLSSLSLAAAMPQDDNIPAADALQEPGNVPSANTTSVEMLTWI